MTLTQVEELLREQGISYDRTSYDGEASYWHHVTLFPYTKNAKDCPVTVLVLKSNNGNRDIELQFNDEQGEYQFVDLRYGSFRYELFDLDATELPSTLLQLIRSVMGGSVSVLVAYDLKRKRWNYDCSFNTNDPDDTFFGKPGFEKAIRRIEAPKSFLAKLFHRTTQYEIYDWNHFRSVVK